VAAVNATDARPGKALEIDLVGPIAAQVADATQNRMKTAADPIDCMLDAAKTWVRIYDPDAVLLSLGPDVSAAATVAAVDAESDKIGGRYSKQKLRALIEVFQSYTTPILSLNDDSLIRTISLTSLVPSDI